jgi:hypothetical protein
VWQALRNELHPKGFELVAVGLDTLGGAGCRAFIEAAKPQHPSLIDQHHVLADLFGVINIPSSVWIDERGMIVRPAEAAPPPPQDGPTITRLNMPSDLPQRFVEIMGEAAKITSDAQSYHDALRDWVDNGSASRFALSPEEVVAHANFALATQLEMDGHHEAAIPHFREAHRLVPESWTFRRQAWSLEKVIDGPLQRFWQGPDPANPEAWPYDGDWLADVRREGAENYNEPWKP